MQKQNDLAIRDLTKAIELAPDRSAASYGNRAAVHITLQDFESALSDMNKAIAGRPNSAGFYHNRAVIYFYLGRYQESQLDENTAKKLGFRGDPGFEANLKKALAN